MSAEFTIVANGRVVDQKPMPSNRNDAIAIANLHFRDRSSIRKIEVHGADGSLWVKDRATNKWVEAQKGAGFFASLSPETMVLGAGAIGLAAWGAKKIFFSKEEEPAKTVASAPTEEALLTSDDRVFGIFSDERMAEAFGREAQNVGLPFVGATLPLWTGMLDLQALETHVEEFRPTSLLLALPAQRYGIRGEMLNETQAKLLNIYPVAINTALERASLAAKRRSGRRFFGVLPSLEYGTHGFAREAMDLLIAPNPSANERIL